MSVLGRMTPARFVRDHWHREPLLVRQALPGFGGILTRDQLLALATRPDATSRLVIEHPRRRRGRWDRHDGPFGALDAAMLPATHWTLLVHGVESLWRGGWELLRRFDFLPAARIDDLMISYAAPGGGVGPHDDAYDVFLLQGPGRRRWQIARGGSRAHDPDAGIKVLREFAADEEWLLEPGDMLYLPPGVAHWGVADGECFTYSIGFLAPSHRDLIGSFLGWLGNARDDDGERLIGSVETAVAREPLALPPAMADEVARLLDGVRWDRGLVDDFLGCFLTRPKPQVQFTVPRRPLDEEAFARRLHDGGGRHGGRRAGDDGRDARGRDIGGRDGRGRLTLALPTRGLLRRGRIYCNGEAHRVQPATQALFARLVRERSLPLPLATNEHARALLYGWYRAGWLHV